MAIGFPVKDDYVTGDVLTAANMNDLSGSVNLLESAQYAAGKNKIINGDFSINQRAFTSTTTTNTYGFDRWLVTNSDGTTTYSAQTFTPGAAPVAGYEGINFARLVSTGQTLTTAISRIENKIEDVRTFAGDTITISFWAKASSGTPNIAVNPTQNFGSGGSTTVVVTGQKFAITTSWARYSKTFSIPSVSGKTIGTSSFLRISLWISAGSDQNTATDSLGIQSTTVDFWGVQVEANSTASEFQTATGTLQGELAACQRYYWRTGGDSANSPIATGASESTTKTNIFIQLPVSMRINPTTFDWAGSGGLRVWGYNTTAVFQANVTSAAIINSNKNCLYFQTTVASGLSQGYPTNLDTGGTSTNFLGISAEL